MPAHTAPGGDVFPSGEGTGFMPDGLLTDIWNSYGMTIQTYVLAAIICIIIYRMVSPEESDDGRQRLRQNRKVAKANRRFTDAATAIQTAFRGRLVRRIQAGEFQPAKLPRPKTKNSKSKKEPKKGK